MYLELLPSQHLLAALILEVPSHMTRSPFDVDHHKYVRIQRPIRPRHRCRPHDHFLGVHTQRTKPNVNDSRPFRVRDCVKLKLSFGQADQDGLITRSRLLLPYVDDNVYGPATPAYWYAQSLAEVS